MRPSDIFVPMHRRSYASIHTGVTALILATTAATQNGDRDGEEQPPVRSDVPIPAAPALSVDEALDAFVLQPGFSISCIAAEPLIHDPVQVAFDAHGALWVAEMRGYMPDADGTGEREPVGRISILHDDDGDGVMDRAEVWVDDVVLPRGVLPLGEGRGVRAALTIEPPRIVYREDRDGDGRPDHETVLAEGITAGIDNPEHAANSPVYGLDGWIHFANHNRAYRQDGDRWISRREPVRGQWGLSQDAAGRLFYNYNSDYLRADLVAPHWALSDVTPSRARGINVQLDADQRVYPVRPTPGVNRGYQPGLLDAALRLTRFTATCAPFVLRSGALGEDARGNAFVCEPAANLVRRARIESQGGVLRARNAYDDAEFLASTDERFRPVHMASGPDGALYVVDFYRGILQHREFLTTFLRRQIEERGLETPIGSGRIWRIAATSDRSGAPTPAKLAELDPKELVSALRSDSGFVRSTAQRLLVERGDTDVLAQLMKVTLDHGEPMVARGHAAWAYAGLARANHRALDLFLTNLASGTAPMQDLLVHGMRIATEGPDPRYRASSTGYMQFLALVTDARLYTDASRPARLQYAAALGRAYEATNSATRFQTDEAMRKFVRGAATDGMAASLLVYGMGDRLLELVVPGTDAPLPRTWWGALTDAVLKRQKGPEIEFLQQQISALEDDELAEFARSLAKAMPQKAPDPDAALAKRIERGRAHYTYCATCHQRDGRGLSGLAPTLVGTDWVLGSADRLVRITTHGMTGPVEIDGTRWSSVMPPPPRLQDGQLADLLTFLRRSWGNHGDPVSEADVARVRAEVRDRTTPWTAEELSGR